MAELLIGAGSNRAKMICSVGRPVEWTKLTTLDFNEDHHPDVVHDLNDLPLPFSDNSFDEIHAYEVMEHLGEQGTGDDQNNEPARPRGCAGHIFLC